jgi:hypothetical protein
MLHLVPATVTRPEVINEPAAEVRAACVLRRTVDRPLRVAALEVENGPSSVSGVENDEVPAHCTATAIWPKRNEEEVIAAVFKFRVPDEPVGDTRTELPLTAPSVTV